MCGEKGEGGQVVSLTGSLLSLPDPPVVLVCVMSDVMFGRVIGASVVEAGQAGDKLEFV